MDEKDILDKLMYLSLLMRDYTEEFSKGRLNIRTEVVVGHDFYDLEEV